MKHAVRNLTQHSDTELKQLFEIVSEHESLEDVLHWARAHPGYSGSETFVIQDEFTHDAVFPTDQGLYAVYGLT